MRLAEQLEEFADLARQRLSGAEREFEPEARCPACGAELPYAGASCRACEAAEPADTAPATWTLFRLWRFARPYRRWLALGFVLTLASTAATLVPPYLTMPLMDDVLIPFQNGQPIDVDLVGMYLGGLLRSRLPGRRFD